MARDPRRGGRGHRGRGRRRRAARVERARRRGPAVGAVSVGGRRRRRRHRPGLRASRARRRRHREALRLPGPPGRPQLLGLVLPPVPRGVPTLQGGAAAITPTRTSRSSASPSRTSRATRARFVREEKADWPMAVDERGAIGKTDYGVRCPAADLVHRPATDGSSTGCWSGSRTSSHWTTCSTGCSRSRASPLPTRRSAPPAVVPRSPTPRAPARGRAGSRRRA